MPKISVIMPTYKVEKYFRQCIESVINQTLTDIEIIPVDDGSPDNCGAIMDEYAAKDPRIKPIHQPNGGYGKAVNAGIEAATGEYIGIVETDDFIEPDMYEKLYNLAKNNEAEIAKCTFVEISSYNNSPLKKKTNWSQNFELPKGVFCIYDHPEFLYFHPSIWSCIYKTSFIKENNIQFLTPKGAAWADNLFQVQTLCLAKRIIYTDEPYYNYRKHTFLECGALKNYKIPFERTAEIHQWLKEKNITDTNILAFLYKREIAYIHIVLGMLKISEFNDAFKLIRQLISAMDTNVITTNANIKPQEKSFIKMCKSTPLLAIIYEKLKNSRKVLLSIRLNKHEKSIRLFGRVIKHA